MWHKRLQNVAGVRHGTFLLTLNFQPQSWEKSWEVIRLRWCWRSRSVIFYITNSNELIHDFWNHESNDSALPVHWRRGHRRTDSRGTSVDLGQTLIDVSRCARLQGRTDGLLHCGPGAGKNVLEKRSEVVLWFGPERWVTWQGEFQRFPETFSSAEKRILMEVALWETEVDHKIKHRHRPGFKIGISKAPGGGACGLQTFFFNHDEIDVSHFFCM